MKKKWIIFVIAAAMLIAVILGIMSETKQEQEISSGARLVFGRDRDMKETDETDIVVNQAKCENEIFRKCREDTIGY